ncbi:hypothetical protein BK133_22350 [Paenibacillus sp. FSL H8-0548]|uniref:hypothetical protein n=1 Tax=Paenibacillus sp. FSL H8-0548 TaxID=1920422 RepID=UPI00096EC407|nr:hypothetical protein [Paenibacillus sp. FSL H8-0548]OMF24838.1 hypothetical protein BK133_22350 [Paenibacillus sp. FSL H8-0548]
MRRIRFIKVWLAVSILISSSALLFPARAAACSCVKPGSVQEADVRSDAVFEGTVTKVKPTSARLLSSSVKAVKASFQVNEVWKGHVSPTIEVLTAEGSDSCGYEFVEGERYLVYATATGKALEVNLCSQTVLHSKADEQFMVLGSGSLPPQPNLEEQLSNDVFARNLIVFLSVIVAASSGLLLYRRYKGAKSRT